MSHISLVCVGGDFSLVCVLVVCLQIPKGTTVGKFLEQVRLQLVQEFADVRSLGSDDLMYIKEDLIIPHVRHHAVASHPPSPSSLGLPIVLFHLVNFPLLPPAPSDPGKLPTAHPCAV